MIRYGIIDSHMMKNGKYIDISNTQFNELLSELSIKREKRKTRDTYSEGMKIEDSPGDVLVPIYKYLSRGDINKLKMNKVMRDEINKRYESQDDGHR